MYRLIIILALSAVSAGCNSSGNSGNGPVAPDSPIASSIGGAEYDTGDALAIDSDRNVFTAGTFFGTMDIDPGGSVEMVVSNGSADMYITKVDREGNFLWGFGFGGTTYDVIAQMVSDSDGNIYAAGYFGGTVDFEPGRGTTMLASAGESDAFLLKLDTNGNLLWVIPFGDTGTDLGFDLALNDSGDVIVSGAFSNTVDFDPGIGEFLLTSSFGIDVFVVSVDSEGEFNWAITFGGGSFDRPYGIDVDGNGNVLLSGTFINTVDLDPGPGESLHTSNGLYDIYILKLDPNGEFIWGSTIGGIGEEWGYDIDVDGDGFINITGQFGGLVDFDPGKGEALAQSIGQPDPFVAQYDPNGDFAWVIPIKADGLGVTDAGWSVASDIQNTIYVTGAYSGYANIATNSANFNISSLGGSDLFIFAVTSNGVPMWVDSYGGPGNDGGRKLTVDSGSNLYITGYFQNTVSFPAEMGGDLTSSGDFDAFTLKVIEDWF